MNEKQRKTNKEKDENTTKYGEFVSSYFTWLSPSEQKKKAQELSKITKEDKKQSSKEE